MGSFLNGKNIEDETIEESKINGGFPGGGGTTITNINQLFSALQGTQTPEIALYNPLGIYNQDFDFQFYDLKSPPASLVPSFFSDWKFIIEVDINKDGFATVVNTIDFGLLRDHTINANIYGGPAVPIPIRAFFQRKSYPDDTIATYKTAYATAEIPCDIII